MFVGTLWVRLHLPWARSLKDKRMEVKSLCGRLQSRFGVAVAEVDHQDLLQSAVLGAACVCTSASQCEQVLDKLAGFVTSHTDGEVLEIRRDIFKEGESGHGSTGSFGDA